MALLANTPSQGYVRWESASILYNGVVNAITDNQTNKRYIFWQAGFPNVFQSSDSWPVLTVADCVVFVNILGEPVSVLEMDSIHGSAIEEGTINFRQIATDAIRADHIKAGAITAAHISVATITAEHLQINSIKAEHITVGSITADKIDVEDLFAHELTISGIYGHIKSEHYEKGSYGFFLGYHPTQGADYFEVHNAIIRGNITATSGAIGGITVASGKLYTGNGLFATNDGLYMDSTGQFALKDKLKWDGTTLTVNGTITMSSTSTVNGVTASTLTSQASAGNTAASDTTTFRTTTVPNGAFSAASVTPTATADGAMNLAVAWTRAAGTVLADFIILLLGTGATAPTMANATQVVYLEKSKVGHTFYGLPVGTYSCAITSGRYTVSGEVYQALYSTSMIDKTATANITVAINSVAASTVTTNASNGATAFSNTTDFRITGAPNATNITLTAVTSTSNSDGSLDITLPWSFTEGSRVVQFVAIHYVTGASDPSADSPHFVVAKTGVSQTFILRGWPAGTWSFCLRLGRTSSAGDEWTDINVTALWRNRVFPGYLVGFTLSATSFTSTRIGIYSGASNTARVEVGTSTYIAGINSPNVAGDIAFWAGSTHANRAAVTTPVRIYANGTFSFGPSGSKIAWNGTTLTVPAVTITGLLTAAQIDTDSLFAQQITVPTGGRIRYETGTGVQKRAVQLADEKIDWIDTPDTSPASPEVLRARIGRLGVGSSVLMDGEFRTKSIAQWFSSTSIFNPSIRQDEIIIIEQANGVLRQIYRLYSPSNYLATCTSSDGGSTWSSNVFITTTITAWTPHLCETFSGRLICVFRSNSTSHIYRSISDDGGSTWSALSIIVSGLSYYPRVLQLPSGKLFLTYSTSDNLYYRISTDNGTSWGSPFLIVSDSLSCHAIVQHDGAIRIAYTSGTALLTRLSYDEGATWSSVTTIYSLQCFIPTIIQHMDKTFRVTVKSHATGYLLEFTSIDGVTWSSASALTSLQVYYPWLTELTNGTCLITITNSGGYGHKLALHRYPQLGAGIVETGSNTDGNYIKFSDGTMQCMCRGACTPYPVVITLPHAFINNTYHAVATGEFHTSGYMIVLGTPANYTKSASTISLWPVTDSGAQLNNASVFYNLIAVGRWS